MTRLFKIMLLLLPTLALASSPALAGAPPTPISQATQACLDCHSEATPGIVANWKKGRMAMTTPGQALKKPELERRISAANIPAELMNVAVGCAECHTMRGDKHQDSFEHGDGKVHIVVTPPDCATCHPQEVDEYSKNLMSHARTNLAKNPLYMDLVNKTSGTIAYKGKKVAFKKPDPMTQAESCFYCHGTDVKVTGTQTREAGDFGEMTFPVLSGWPNHGVGRYNPDNSQGSCTPCHTRHQFSIAMARSAYTCSECHKGPDVPVYKVYQVSKHGNMFYAQYKDWDMKKVPWTPGQDFSAPTCATCHASLLTDSGGNVIAKRTHQMADRIWWRLLGLIPSHPHPLGPDTTGIRNAAGMPLATGLDGKWLPKYFIGPQEQAARKKRMMKVCSACHSAQWAAGQMARLDNTIKSADAGVVATNQLMLDIWKQGLAQGPPKHSPFDEFVEKLWVEQWLMYANSTRFASAMMGADMGVFDLGRWFMGKTIQQMHDWQEIRQKK